MAPRDPEVLGDERKDQWLVQVRLGQIRLGVELVKVNVPTPTNEIHFIKSLRITYLQFDIVDLRTYGNTKGYFIESVLTMCDL